MHWTRPVVALKSNKGTLQVTDLSQKTKVQSAIMNEEVIFWKWFSTESLGLITETSVYHWNVLDPNPNTPTKLCDRTPNLNVRFGPTNTMKMLKGRNTGLSNH